jgi:hypothetical protein
MHWNRRCTGLVDDANRGSPRADDLNEVEGSNSVFGVAIALPGEGQRVQMRVSYFELDVLDQRAYVGLDIGPSLFSS